MMTFLGFVAIVIVFGTIGHVRQKRKLKKDIAEYLLYMDERIKLQESYRKRHEELVKNFEEIEE